MNVFVNHPARTRSVTATRMSAKAKVMATAIAVALSGVSPAAFAQNNAISPAYLTGVWQENAQCRGSEAMVFFPNNTMSSAGSPPANYAVTGPSQFTMYGPGGAIPIQAQQVNYNQMVVTVQNSAIVVYRCGAANAGAGTPQVVNTNIVGGWGHNSNCATPEVFVAGGQFRSSQNDLGRWSLSGNLLRLNMNNGNSLDFSVQVNTPQNITMTQTNNGQVSNYTRCF
jgi:hypothetical protein